MLRMSRNAPLTQMSYSITPTPILSIMEMPVALTVWAEMPSNYPYY